MTRQPSTTCTSARRPYTSVTQRIDSDEQCVQQLMNAAFNFKLDSSCFCCQSDNRREINMPELPRMLRLRLAHGCVPRLKEVVSLAAAAPLCAPEYANTLRFVVVLVDASHYVAVVFAKRPPSPHLGKSAFWDATMWRTGMLHPSICCTSWCSRGRCTRASSHTRRGTWTHQPLFLRPWASCL